MKTLIVALDGSPRADAVVEAGHIMAERLDAKIILVSVVDGLEYRAMLPPELVVWDDPRVWAEVENGLRARLDRAADRLPRGQVVEKVVTYGGAAELILSAAQKHRASLIVLGAHGYRPLERFAGTTASRVANRAPTSVLVVRQAKGLPAPVSFERIVVGCDRSKRASSVVAAAANLAAPSNGRLCLVRAANVISPMPPSLEKLRPGEIEGALVAMARKELSALRAGLPDGVSSEVDARIGFAWEVVLDAAKAKEAGLIVIGSHGYQGLDLVLGTTAGRIVNQADRSVMIVRETPAT